MVALAGGHLGINFDAAAVPGVKAVMALSALTGTGTLAGTTSVSPSGGFASFNGLNITGPGTDTGTGGAAASDIGLAALDAVLAGWDPIDGFGVEGDPV
jgi:hypothetical protein